MKANFFQCHLYLQLKLICEPNVWLRTNYSKLKIPVKVLRAYYLLSIQVVDKNKMQKTIYACIIKLVQHINHILHINLGVQNFQLWCNDHL